MLRLILLHAAAVAACSALFAQAQVGGGDVSGVITDPQGATVAGARITAVARDRGISRSAITGGAGEYRVLLLPPGEYTVRVEASGFAVHVVEHAAVQVGQTLTLNVQLRVGAVNTEVTVEAGVPVVE